MKLKIAELDELSLSVTLRPEVRDLLAGNTQSLSLPEGLAIAKSALFYLQDWALDIRTLAHLTGSKYVYEIDQIVGGVVASVKFAQDVWVCYHTGVSRWRLVLGKQRTGKDWYAKLPHAAG
jgi:hypothetical protein